MDESQRKELGVSRDAEAELGEGNAKRIRLFRLVLMVAHSMRTRMDEALRGDGLTTQQAALITAVEAMGSPSLTQAAAVLGTTHQNSRQVADALVRKGFLRIVQDPQDGRVRRLVTTPTPAPDGLQVTAQRLAVLRAVADRPHLDGRRRIPTSCGAEMGAISRQAVYDALAAFTDRGLLRRIQPAGAPARYENRVGDNHHHLICRTCHRMVDVDCAVGYAPCLTAGDALGFEIDEAEVVYWGRCPECAAGRRASDVRSETTNGTGEGTT
jgi:Fur family transcriptional regulator, stress-responsive regulator